MEAIDRHAELVAQLIEQRSRIRQLILGQACLAAAVIGLAVALAVVVVAVL